MVVTKILKTPLIVRVPHKVNTRLLFLKEKMLHCFWSFCLGLCLVLLTQILLKFN